MVEGGDLQRIEHLLELNKNITLLEDNFFKAKSLQERIEAATGIQKLAEQEKASNPEYKHNYLDLFNGLIAAEKEFSEAKIKDEQSEAKGKLDFLVQQIRELNPKYRFECLELQKYAEEKRRFQRAPTNNVSDAIMKNMKKIAEFLSEFPKLEKKSSDLATAIEKYGKILESYKTGLKSYRRRTFWTIVITTLSAALVLGTIVYFSSKSFGRKVEKYAHETEKLRSELEIANKSIDRRIAEANLPMIKAIDDIYKITANLGGRIECIEQDYVLFNNIQNNVQELQKAIDKDREKYAPLASKVDELEARIKTLNSNTVDKKYFEEKMKEIRELYLDVKKRVDKKIGTNYGP